MLQCNMKNREITQTLHVCAHNRANFHKTGTFLLTAACEAWRVKVLTCCIELLICWFS